METTQQVIAGVYSRLHRPSQAKLHYMDVLEVVNDLLRGYFQDRVLGEKDQMNVTAEITLTKLEIDYLLQVGNAEDFEPVSLEYSNNTEQAANRRYWTDADLVPFDSFPQAFDRNNLVATIYGSPDVGAGYMIRFNQTDDYISNTRFRLTYRPSLVAVVQMGERPPLPNNFIPMLKCEAALLCIARVKDNSTEWMNRAVMLAESLRYELEGDRNPNNWRRRWQKHLDTSVEPTQQPLRRFDSFRQTGSRNYKRGYRIVE